jgi:hypothetical protein
MSTKKQRDMFNENLNTIFLLLERGVEKQCTQNLFEICHLPNKAIVTLLGA